MFRFYVDCHGELRHAILIEEVPYLTPYGQAHRWKIDGAILQIPVMAWDLVKKIYDMQDW